MTRHSCDECLSGHDRNLTDGSPKRDAFSMTPIQTKDSKSDRRAARTRRVCRLLDDEMARRFTGRSTADDPSRARSRCSAGSSDSFSENRPYDQFARELLTYQGNTSDEGPGSFYKVAKKPEEAVTSHQSAAARSTNRMCSMSSPPVGTLDPSRLRRTRWFFYGSLSQETSQRRASLSSHSVGKTFHTPALPKRSPRER